MAKKPNLTQHKETDDMAKIPVPPPRQAPAAPKSILSRLKVAEGMQRNATVNIPDPKIRARTKFVEGINEQVKHVEHEMKGEEYAPTRFKYVDGPDGKRVKTEAPKRRMLWYWQQDDTFYTEVRYGSSPVNFGAGTALECGAELSDVLDVYATVVEAAESGELDTELARLSEGRGRKKAASEPEQPVSPKERLQQRSRTP